MSEKVTNKVISCCLLIITMHFFSGCESIHECPVGKSVEEVRENEVIKAIARRWFNEVINQRNLDVITDIYSPDYIHHGPEGAEMRGLESVRAFAASILAASNDRRAVVEQQVAEGNLVVTRFRSSGHQTGVFQGVEPTGKIWNTEGIVISRIENGKIVEDWEIVHFSWL